MHSQLDIPEVKLSSAAIQLEPENAVTRVGIIALSTDLTTERDARSLIPAESAAYYISRISFQNPSTPENLALMGPDLAKAAELLVPGIELAAIAYSCTAASVEIGDDVISDAVQSVRPGVPVVTPPDAAVTGFAALGISRIALVTPYVTETTEPMAAYFSRRGLNLVSVECMGIGDDREIARISRQTIIEAALAADRPEAEGVFLSCTALPAIGVIDELEARLGKPVISSNQAFIWQLLRHARSSPAPEAPGRLFMLDKGLTA